MNAAAAALTVLKMNSDLYERKVALKGTFEEAMAFPRLNERKKLLLQEFQWFQEHMEEGPVLVHDLIGNLCGKEPAVVWGLNNAGRVSDTWVEGFYVFKQLLNCGVFVLVENVC